MKCGIKIAVIIKKYAIRTLNLTSPHRGEGLKEGGNEFKCGKIGSLVY
jgi:hypothetical protein